MGGLKAGENKTQREKLDHRIIGSKKVKDRL